MKLLLLLMAVASISAQGIQDVLKTFPDTPQARYPTDFTRGILPIPIHSHNDYWRPAPLYTALSVGASSIESDIFLLNSTLYVGHDRASLTPARTLASLYIDPLVDILTRMNPPLFDPSSSSGASTGSDGSAAVASSGGVWDVVPEQTTYLWLDLKTAPGTTFPAAVAALAPLRERGWLTTHNPATNTTVRGAITVIATGSARRADIEALSVRDVFWDAPLLRLDADGGVTGALSPFASTDLKSAVGEVGMAGMTEAQVARVRSQVVQAGRRGVGVRYWETPLWPVRRRERVWRQLVEAGVGLLGVDEVERAALGDW
ncbi:hypothetical protein EDC01DRAFT_634865 [Geopyxis carbonaria]|nr:hypothetical protein EDC01DRAFT_634865 [Geopyxis carbonaria]